MVARTAELADTLVGMPEQEAIAAVAAAGLTYRISAQDGETMMLTMDYVASRINLDIADGKVTGAVVG